MWFNILNSFIFWAAWIAIPMVMEIIPSVGSLFILLKRRKSYKKKETPTLYPEISIIIPVYNSADTLEGCLRSIDASTYPNDAIRVFLVNNLSRDNSFEVFTQCQDLFPDLHMQWLNAQQGKSRALNLALYNSSGKYIVHIDSDGFLEPHALTNLVDLFESDLSCNCVTGSILTIPEKIEEYTGSGLLLRRLEFLEYAQAFLAGRNYAGETNTIYTLSGAFSAFRKSAILKSWLYNTDTICEDTQLTFQMRYLQKERVRISVDSIFLTDPIEDLDKLYTQRQRWQRGSLEVSRMFMGTDELKARKLFSDVNVKTLMYDHTFAFPRMIWYLATICMLFLGFSGKTILMATALLFGLYTLCGYFYFFSSLAFLEQFPELRKYYRRQWWLVPLLPFFNLMVFFIRMAGIINSIGTDSSWKTRTFTDEKKSFAQTIRQDFSKVTGWVGRLQEAVNGDPDEMYAPKSLDQRLRGSFWGYAATFAAFAGALVLTVMVAWGIRSFTTPFESLVSTFFSSTQGTAAEVYLNGLKSCLPPILVALAAAVGLIVLDRRQTKKVLAWPESDHRKHAAGKILRRRNACAVFACLFLVGALLFANAAYGVTDYASAKLVDSTIYENHYVDPKGVTITAPAQKPNLLHIYLESMEVTYGSTAQGGALEKSLIPNLTRLARDNVSFSQTDKPLGGFYSGAGTSWTMAALYSTASGAHFALPAGGSRSARSGHFAAGLWTIGDVLAQNGYQNELLLGSNAEFSGLDAFFLQHGNFEIFDYPAAIEKGLIPEDYHQWWGFEDAKLYEYAKAELTRLSQSGQPFDLTMVTADTHFPEGYVCQQCPTDKGERAANVIACADRQLGDFIRWCQAQPFYENTVIVITGDHPRMDNVVVGETPWAQRGVYNCFINSRAQLTVAEGPRAFTAMDIYPTTLAAMGFTIDGDALGLGVDLFSGRFTLAEKLGYEVMDQELEKNSAYYIPNLAPELLDR